MYLRFYFLCFVFESYFIFELRFMFESLLCCLNYVLSLDHFCIWTTFVCDHFYVWVWAWIIVCLVNFCVLCSFIQISFLNYILLLNYPYLKLVIELPTSSSNETDMVLKWSLSCLNWYYNYFSKYNTWYGWWIMDYHGSS